jgi:bifunctional non-homologous end joining protein LigD
MPIVKTIGRQGALMMGQVTIESREFALSNLDKVLWPDDGYTKGELIHYYVQVADYLLPHLRGRPLVLTRFPDGIHRKSFYQKNAPDYLPPWIRTFSWYSEDSQRDILFIVAEEAATLAWLANQACIEMHPWLSSIESIDNPDFAVIDLDPSPGSRYQDVVDIALVVKELLDNLGLRSYPKTSGSAGLHIYIPVEAVYTYEQVRKFAHVLASMVTEVLPHIATIERAVKKRSHKVYVDYLQNVLGKTLSSVYSVRPRPGAPVSTPLLWDEVSQITPAQFTIKTILSRLRDYGDLFAPVLQDRQNLEPACHKLGLPIF